MRTELSENPPWAKTVLVAMQASRQVPRIMNMKNEKRVIVMCQNVGPDRTGGAGCYPLYLYCPPMQGATGWGFRFSIQPFMALFSGADTFAIVSWVVCVYCSSQATRRGHA